MRFIVTLTNLFFLLTLAIFPFGARILVHQFTFGFHEYESVFLYASDFSILAFLFFSAWRFGPRALHPGSKLLMIFIAAATFSVIVAPDGALALYSLLRLCVFILFALCAAIAIRADKPLFERALIIIALSAVIQSIIGIAQFIAQRSIGLRLFGESVVGSSAPGSAKVALEGAKLIRSYGTFPHPNVFAAFLILGLISLSYLWVRRPSPRKFFDSFRNLSSDLVIGGGIFIVAMALIFSFSRSGWAIGAFAAALIIAYAVSSKQYFIQGIRLLILCAAIFIILIFSFGSFIFPRAHVALSEPALNDRLVYDSIGLQITKTKPFGVGIGNQVLYAYENGLFRDNGMTKVWQWQPIHNLYLLMASEIGILGLGVFLALIVLIFSRLRGSLPLEKLTVIVLFGSVLVLGLFDHYFWTLEQGKLILWLVIGLALGAGYASETARPKIS